MKIERNFHEGKLSVEAHADGAYIRRERFHADMRETSIRRYSEADANLKSLYEGEGKVTGPIVGPSLTVRFNAGQWAEPGKLTSLSVSTGHLDSPEAIDQFIELLKLAKTEWARIEQ